jgi:hypothetical protein
MRSEKLDCFRNRQSNLKSKIKMAEDPGLEPGMADPESAVLPITPILSACNYYIGRNGVNQSKMRGALTVGSIAQ